MKFIKNPSKCTSSELTEKEKELNEEFEKTKLKLKAVYDYMNKLADSYTSIEEELKKRGEK